MSTTVLSLADTLVLSREGRGGRPILVGLAGDAIEIIPAGDPTPISWQMLDALIDASAEEPIIDGLPPLVAQVLRLPGCAVAVIDDGHARPLVRFARTVDAALAGLSR